MKHLLLTLLGVLALPGVVRAQAKPLPKELAAALADIKAYETTAWRTDSSQLHPLRACTEAAYASRNAFYQGIYARLRSLDPKALLFDDQVSLELLTYQVQNELAIYRYKAYLNPITSESGFQTDLAQVGTTTLLKSKQDAEQYLRVLHDVPRYVAENLQLMRTGLALGISQPQAVLPGYELTYTQHLVARAEESVFWQPFTKKPAAISDADWLGYQVAARTSIMQDVVGSYRQMQQFFDQEYLPKTRRTLGAFSFPNGKAFYQDRVRYYTTTNLTAEEVYQLGLREVDRISAAMESVIRQAGFKGNRQEFIAFLRTDPQFYPKKADELLKDAAYIAKKSEGQLPRLFGKLPRQPFAVVPVPAYLAPAYTGGRYSGAPIRSTRAGEYWVNTSNLPSRTLYTLEALTLHEAVPGHHLQTALAQELDSLPEFRRNLYISAFGEGWGLYSEYLGHEMGFYQDPYSLFGRLTYEMWRACRLVIDVGIHTKGWTREQAVRYLADRTALSLHEVNTEVNRYISWPGQALAYKVGEIKIREMRQKAEAALKADFDVRAFHDMVLSNGSVTLAVLEKMTDRFIAQQLAKQRPAKP
jgi:uncharacterized protein (DUF885 family)